MLDLELKQKLAKAARELADEVEANNGPELGFGLTFRDDGTPCCAMGHVYHKAGIDMAGRRAILRSDEDLARVAYPVENANDAKFAPHLVMMRGALQPLPEALRDYAMAVEGL